jgi:hypothetical protein
MFKLTRKLSKKTLLITAGTALALVAVIAGTSSLLGSMNNVTVTQKDPKVGQFGQKLFARNLQALSIAKAAGKFANSSEIRSIAKRWQTVLTAQDQTLAKWLTTNRGTAYVNPLDTQLALPKAQVLHVLTSKHRDADFAALMRDSALKVLTLDSQQLPMDSTLSASLAKIVALNEQSIAQLERIANGK